MTYLLTNISITEMYTNHGVFRYAKGTLIDDNNLYNNPSTLPTFVTHCEIIIDYIKEKASSNEKVYLDNIFPKRVIIDGQSITVYVHKVTDAITGEKFWVEDPEIIARRILEARNRRAEVI